MDIVSIVADRGIIQPVADGSAFGCIHEKRFRFKNKQEDNRICTRTLVRYPEQHVSATNLGRTVCAFS
jgi:hypothetical protein